MQTKTLERKHSEILVANNATVRHRGQVYLVRAQQLGRITLADAEPIPQGGKPINLFDNTRLSKDLRALVESGNFHR
jgi:hypothetical protein